MRYQIRVAGKIFEGNNLRNLLKRAVEAKRAELQPHGVSTRIVHSTFHGKTPAVEMG